MSSLLFGWFQFSAPAALPCGRWLASWVSWASQFDVWQEPGERWHPTRVRYEEQGNPSGLVHPYCWQLTGTGTSLKRNLLPSSYSLLNGSNFFQVYEPVVYFCAPWFWPAAQDGCIWNVCQPAKRLANETTHFRNSVRWAGEVMIQG